MKYEIYKDFLDGVPMREIEKRYNVTEYGLRSIINDMLYKKHKAKPEPRKYEVLEHEDDSIYTPATWEHVKDEFSPVQIARAESYKKLLIYK